MRVFPLHEYVTLAIQNPQVNPQSRQRSTFDLFPVELKKKRTATLVVYSSVLHYYLGFVFLEVLQILLGMFHLRL